MNQSTILVIHPEVEKKEILKLSAKNHIKIIITDRVDNVPMDAYVENIGFLYHKKERFPFTLGGYKHEYTSSQYMLGVVKEHLSKYLENSTKVRNIDLLSCSLPENAKSEMREWVHTNNSDNKRKDKLLVRYSVDPTGQPGDWIMEETTDINRKDINIQQIYFTDYIKHWDIKLDTTSIFKLDNENGDFENKFIHHKTTKMITLHQDLTYNDIVVNTSSNDGIKSHAYISLPNGYIFNGNGHKIDLSGLPIDVKWKGLIECNAKSRFVNQKNIIKNIGINSEDLNNNQTRLHEGAGYIIRDGQNYFDVYDCYVIGNISTGGGGICGSNTCSNHSKKYEDSVISNINQFINQRINATDVKIYSCYVRGNIGQNAGGIVGQNSGMYNNIKIHSCFTNQLNTSDKIQENAGGILGNIDAINRDASYNTVIDIYSCYNEHNQIESNAGGIVGKVGVKNGVSISGSHYTQIKVNSCYVTAINVDNSAGSIVGNIHNGIYNYDINNDDNSIELVDISNCFSQDFSSNFYKSIGVDYVGVGNNPLSDLSNITQENVNEYGLNEMYGVVSEGLSLRNYPYLRSFHNAHSIDTNIIPTRRGRVVRQNYLYSNDYHLKRGISPWSLSGDLYKNKDEYPVFSDEKDKIDDNVEIMTPIMLLDMLHQQYPSEKSDLNKYYDDEVNAIYEYGDSKIHSQLTKYGSTIPKVWDALGKYVNRRLMMIRTREFLKTMSMDSGSSIYSKNDEIDALLKTRYENNDSEFTIMESVVGDMTRMNKTSLVDNKDIYNDNLEENINEPKYETTIHHQELVKRNIEVSHLSTNPNLTSMFSYRDVYNLHEFKSYYNLFFRINPYDESILGSSRNPETSTIDIKHFVIDDNSSNYGFKFVQEMNEIAIKIGEFMKDPPSEDVYVYPYNSENPAYDISGMQKYYTRNTGDNIDNVHSAIGERRQDEIMWVIYELLKTDKFDTLIKNNLTTLLPPRGEYSDIENKPNFFTSLEDTKKKEVVLNIYNEYKKMYVNPIFFNVNANGGDAQVDGGDAQVDGGDAQVDGGDAQVDGGDAQVDGGDAPVDVDDNDL
jgi:hypothetical protein